jgi:ABC-type glutathione transport system ATPase component
MMSDATERSAIEAGAAGEPLLVVDDLRTYFDLRQGVVKTVDSVSFSLASQETIANIAESELRQEHHRIVTHASRS